MRLIDGAANMRLGISRLFSHAFALCLSSALASPALALSISSVSPNVGPVGTSVTIAGRGFGSTPAANAVTFNGKVAVVSSASSTKLVTKVPIGATTGPLKVKVGNSSTSYNSFTVSNPVSISGVSPTSGSVGINVTISGTGFSTTKTNNAVTFNGKAATVSSASSTQLVVTVPSGATSGPVKVTVGSSSATWNSFTVGASLVITSVSPTSGAVGAAVTITGSGFSTTAANNAVTFNGTTATVSSASSAQLVVTVPAGATTGPVKVAVGGSSAIWNAFTVSAPVNITNVSPTSGPTGMTVTITGSGFSTIASNDVVTFNGYRATVSSATSTQLVAIVPSGATSGPIGVTVGSSSSTWNGFTVTGSPTISDVSPTSGGVRTAVTISGQNFAANPTDNTVFFQGIGTTRVQAAVTAASSTQLTVTVPDAALTGPLFVYLGGAYAQSPAAFTVVPTLTPIVTLTSQAPDPVLIGHGIDVTVAVAPDQTGIPPTGTVYVSETAELGDSCTITLGQYNGCVLRTQTRGPANIRAFYRGDSHYFSAASASLKRNVLGLSLHGFTAQITGAEPSQNGAGTYVQVSLNSSLRGYTGVPYEQPSGLAIVSDGINSCSMYVDSVANPWCYLHTDSAGARKITVSYAGDFYWEPATAPPIWHATSSAGGANALPAQTEICGFDPKADYPVPTGFAPIEQLPGAVPSMGLAPGATGDQPLAVAITSPAADSTTADNLIDVVGTFTGPANTGITVNGIIANTLNGQFVANNVPLSAGANSLNVVATTITGATADATVTVVQGGTPGPISISFGGSGSNAFAPTSIPFNYSLSPLPAGAAVQSIELEYGTGVDPWIGSDISSAPTSISYSVPGVSTLTLNVYDNQGNTYRAQRTVLIQDFVAKRSMLCDVYGYLKDRLKAKDAAGAANAYQSLIHDQYQNQFTAFDTAMPSVATQLGTITIGRISQGYVDMTLVRDNADQTRSGFPLRMTQGSDGVWRISEM